MLNNPMTPSTRRESLDGLRGYAALAVAIFHGILHFDVSQVERVLYPPLNLVEASDMPAKLLLILFNGESAVIAFFILSGFVLRGALDRMAAQRFIEVVPLFTWRRIARIYPAVVSCIALFFLISLIGFPTFPRFTFNQF